MPVTKKDPDPKRFGNKGTLSRLNKVRIKERIIREVYARPLRTGFTYKNA
jgi:hypothetical protein